MSIEQGRVDMASLEGFDNATRSDWPLERSAPPTPITGQPLRFSELPDVLNSDLGSIRSAQFAEPLQFGSEVSTAVQDTMALIHHDPFHSVGTPIRVISPWNPLLTADSGVTNIINTSLRGRR